MRVWLCMRKRNLCRVIFIRVCDIMRRREKYERVIENGWRVNERENCVEFLGSF